VRRLLTPPHGVEIRFGFTPRRFSHLWLERGGCGVAPNWQDEDVGGCRVHASAASTWGSLLKQDNVFTKGNLARTSHLFDRILTHSRCLSKDGDKVLS